MSSDDERDRKRESRRKSRSKHGHESHRKRDKRDEIDRSGDKRKHRRHHRSRRKDKVEEESEESILERGRKAMRALRELLGYNYGLRNEFRELIEQLNQGKALDISGIPDKYAHKKVKEIFDNISLVRRKSDGTYVQRSGGSTLALIAPILDESKEYLQQTYIESVSLDQGVAASPIIEEQEAKIQPSMENAERPAKKSYGPTMPTHTQLKQAEKMMETEAVDDENPLLGPVPPEFIEDLQETDDTKLAEVGRIIKVIDEHKALNLRGENAAAIPPNPYAILGLERTCPTSDIKKRFWKLSLLIHPDKCGHPAAATAFDAVSTAAKRLQDDEELRLVHRQIDEMEHIEMTKALQKEQERENAWKIARGEMKASELTPVGPAKREEWMTQLPTTEPRNNQIPEKGSKSFKTRSSAPQDHSWTLRPGEQGPQLPSAQGPSVQETNIPMQRREKSLLEKHLELKKLSKTQEQSIHNPTQRKYKPFDRERDLEMKKSLNPSHVLQGMKGLGNRFGKGSHS